ncbi:hypothetical protein [Marinimicrobium sp. ARAG 43.8]|uniref:hypothetical protein n=1 Tax=Marinimicrobium sp. ARAG 43.8 TaxID=3418719 RepID=UPI003CF8B240
MKAFLGFFSVAIVLSALVMLPIYFITLRKFIEIMESDFPGDWVKIGSPRLDGSMNVRGSWLLVRYLYSGSYKSTGSDTVIKHGDRAKFLLMAGMLFFLVFVAVTGFGSLYY